MTIEAAAQPFRGFMLEQTRESDIELFVNNIFYVFMLLAWSDPSGLGAVPRRRWQHRQVIEMTKN